MIYVYFLLFQLLNTYAGFLVVANPYIFSVLFIIYGFKEKIKIVNLKLLFVLIFIITSFIIIYSLKFSFTKSFSITAKAIQFNYGYYLLIPGFTVLFGLSKKFDLKYILSATFWIITMELLIEFILIRILGVSPGLFIHYPKVAHITYNQITGEYTADRLLGMAGNASVTGVIYTTSFILYFGYLTPLYQTFSKKKIVLIITFLFCFFMIVSGSAFFAIILSGFVVWSQKRGSLLKNILIAIIILSIVLLVFNYISTLTDLFGNKFTTEYLLLLLNTDDMQGSLPYMLHDMSLGYHWYNFFFGSYYFEWGNADAVIKTVDYFYLNLFYEFGLIGFLLFFYSINLCYKVVRDLGVINQNYLKFGFLTIVFGSFHYPVIAYTASQVFISALAGVAIKDRISKSGYPEPTKLA